MVKAGRNDLCPCGSGRKYKRCCLGKEEAREEFARQLQADALPLLRELGRYASQRSSAAPQSVAAERFPFWRPPLDRGRAARLVDYLIFDYRSGSSRASIEEYLAERGSIVAARWRELMQAWQATSMQLYALEQWSGGFARCRTVLPEGGAIIDVMPLENTELPIEPGAPIALRALPVGHAFIYPGRPVTFGKRSVADVAAAVVARHHAYVRRERIVSLDQFLCLEATAFDEEAASSSPSTIIVPGRA
ncbi:MAG: SEC-C domain-containing protein [Candidatus Eremiobacteraeota bacterium]|nr:SEC-C domain-containing protein [Candidatus Eremiobacteraeota bacterium]